MTSPRIEPGNRREIGVLAWTIARIAGLASGTAPPNLFLTLGRHRGLFFGWLHFAGRLMPRGRLPRRETELVILRVAHLRGCDYELEHHRRLAGAAGVSPADLARVAEAGVGVGWSARERALLAATDQLVETRALDDDAWAALREHLEDPTAIELVLLVTHYDLLATTIGALRIEPDQPRAGSRAAVAAAS